MPIRQDTRPFHGVYCLLFVSIVIRIIRWPMCALCPNGTHDIDRENGERRIQYNWESTMRFRAERISHLHYFHKENPCIHSPSSPLCRGTKHYSVSLVGVITALRAIRSNRCDALRSWKSITKSLQLDRFWINYELNFTDKYIVQDIWLRVIVT